MLLKHRDGAQAEIRELNAVLGLRLSVEQRRAAELELEFLATRERKAREVADRLDYFYQESRNWALIHDLRIENNGERAEIGHLLIDRFLDVYVLEANHYHQAMKISEEGRFLVWTGREHVSVDSPLEQSRRQIEVLRQAVGERDLGPRRLGYPIPIKYRSVIVFSSSSNLLKPDHAPLDLFWVLSLEEFADLSEKYVSEKAALDSSKMVGYDVLREFGEKVVRLHRRRSPADFFEKYRVAPEPSQHPSA